MASSVSSPSKPVDDELKLDELVSELQALKKLYGLLQNNSARPARPDQPTAHALDEKSRHLLKKLLDGATQQALQSQAKMLSFTPETPKSHAEPNSNLFHNDIQKEVRETQKNQECHSAVPPENPPEAAISTPVAQPEITQNPCPIPEPTRPNHRRSKDATVHRCRANDSAHLDRRIMSRPSESGSRRKSSQPSKNGSRPVQSIRSGGSERPPSSEKGGELLPLVPVQKRARVEPVDLPSRASSRTNKPDQIDRELTHQKRNNRKETGAEPKSIRSMQRTHSSKYQNCRSIVLVGNQMAQIVQKNDKLAESNKTRVTSNKHQKPARLNRSKAKRFSSSSRESTQSISDSAHSIPLTQLKQNRIKTGKKVAPPPPPPPPPPILSNRKARGSPSLTKSLIVQRKDQLRETKSRAGKPIKPARPNRSRAGRYSSSSTGSTRSKSVLSLSTRADLLTPRNPSRVNTRIRRRRAPPPPSSKPPIPHHPIVPRWQRPPSRPGKTCVMPKKEEEDEQGRFKKLTNKLAIIFHHHHHHHHHLHAGEDGEGGGGGRKDHERSLWKYLKGVHHVRKGSGEEKGKLHGHNLRVMMEWFFHHLWWMRQRQGKKKVEKRRLAKKVKWWEWFRRKGGMVVGGRRRVRLQLGYNGSHRRAAGGKG